MTIDRLGFGVRHGLPEDAKSAWGCRAIVDQGGTFDMLPDRQDVSGTPDILQALMEVFTPHDLAEVVGDLLRTGWMRTREQEAFVLHQDDRIVVVADTQASAGYCYVSAWMT